MSGREMRTTKELCGRTYSCLATKYPPKRSLEEPPHSAAARGQIYVSCQGVTAPAPPNLLLFSLSTGGHRLEINFMETSGGVSRYWQRALVSLDSTKLRSIQQCRRLTEHWQCIDAATPPPTAYKTRSGTR